MIRWLKAIFVMATCNDYERECALLVIADIRRQ